MKTKYLTCLFSILLFALAGCSDEENTGSCDLENPDCGEGLVCEAVQDGEAHCFSPLRILGSVLSAEDDSAIEGALVQAVDVNGAAIGTSAETDSSGNFSITLPSTRDAEGNPVSGSYTLRAQAAGFQSFPTAIRPALPLDATTATTSDSGWIIENALTTIKLLVLPTSTTGLGSISGNIQAVKNSGILVVAETETIGYTGYSDTDGNYTIFNVPAGSYTVRGYSAGVQLTPAEATIAADEEKTGVDLTESEEPLSTISGTIQLVNAPGGAMTSVVLAVESTFVENSSIGEVPMGLRVGDITGAFEITDVPNGKYVVLAAFENDDLVRDPDQTIGGTSLVRVEVPDPTSGNTIVLPEGFKVTGALCVVSPGAEGPEAVDSLTPTLIFCDDSSEDGYEINVYNAYGDEIWATDIPSVSGTENVEVTYAGPALEAGMYYQFRASSYRDKSGQNTYISKTEDLKGVFYYQESE
jgi:hypothetical protein